MVEGQLAQENRLEKVSSGEMVAWSCRSWIVVSSDGAGDGVGGCGGEGMGWLNLRVWVGGALDMKSSTKEVECMASSSEAVSESGSGVEDPEDDCKDGILEDSLEGAAGA